MSSADIAQRLLDAHALPALLKVEGEWTGTIRTYASQTLRALQRHHRRAWSPPCAPHGKPTLAYMLLPAAHLSNMQPAIKKSAICRRPTTSHPLRVGGDGACGAGERGGADETVAVGRWAGQEVSAEELKREMDCVHTDLERVEAWLQGRAGCEILSGRCIEAADASIVLHNAGAVKALREFFASDEVCLPRLPACSCVLGYRCRSSSACIHLCVGGLVLPRVAYACTFRCSRLRMLMLSSCAASEY